MKRVLKILLKKFQNKLRFRKKCNLKLYKFNVTIESNE